MTIQEIVYQDAKKVTFPSGDFSIAHIQIDQYTRNGNPMSYKQIRNALYRLRDCNQYRHIGRGVYYWLNAQQVTQSAPIGELWVTLQ